MLVFIIIIAVALFLWWSLVPAKKPIPQNPEEKLVVYIAKLMQNTVDYNLKNAPYNNVEQVVYITGALEGCRNKLKQERAKSLSLQYGIPEPRVLAIIDFCYDHAIKKIWG